MKRFKGFLLNCVAKSVWKWNMSTRVKMDSLVPTSLSLSSCAPLEPTAKPRGGAWDTHAIIELHYMNIYT